MNVVECLMGMICKSQENRDSRILYVFDFDRTVVDDNSEDVYKNFMTTEVTLELLRNDKISHDWPSLCQAILDQIIIKQGLKVDTILRKLAQIPFVPGMDRLLQKIHQSVQIPGKKKKPKTGNHLVLLSGSNQLFIESRLMALRPSVVPDKILANELRFDPVRRSLVYTSFHKNADCPLCCSSLCKGQALDDYVAENGPFDTVYYVGDGGNDICPAQRLGFTDILFVRKGYQLEEYIAKGEFREMPIFINAQIIYFNDGKDVESYMEIPTTRKSCSFF